MADYVIAGSGINALVAASLLALKGRKVLVLERNAIIGGCMRSEEATVPGFTHDVMATTFVLFLLSPAYAALGPELEKRGLAFAHPEIPTGVLQPDGSHLVLTRDRARNIAAFNALADGDGAQYSADMETLGANAPFLFALLGGRLWSWDMAKLMAKETWRRGPRGLSAFFGEALISARHWLQPYYRSQQFHALMAPWVLHCGLGPESTYSGQMAKVIAFALEAAGAPVAALQVVAGAPAWFHPGRSGTIQMGPQNKLGYFGEIHPRVLSAMDVKGPLVAFELILNAIPGSKSKSATRAALVISDLMPLSRDFAFVVDDAVEADKLVKAARGADKALIADVTVFDLYKLDGGKKSLAIEVTLQPKDKTLAEAEIDAVSQKIVQAVTKATGGTLRS